MDKIYIYKNLDIIDNYKEFIHRRDIQINLMNLIT